MAEEEKVTLFVSSGCGVCQEVKKLVEEGKFNLPTIDVVDVASEDGFPNVEKLGLTKVPVAFKGAQECKLLMDGESLFIDCGGENPPRESDEQQNPGETE